MNIFKLTDFGNQEKIIGSKVVQRHSKLGLKKVKKEWLNRIDYAQGSFGFFSENYGFNEKKFIEYYGLSCIQFGNWLDYSERTDRFLTLAVGLYDLQKIFNSIHKMKPNDISNIGCYNQIGIALGARGQRGAIAHFESTTGMINLTKIGGFHSFAHEYGHAIDYVAGQYLSKNNNVFSLSDARKTTINEESGRSGEMRNLMNIIISGVRSGERYQKLVSWSKERHSYTYWCNNTEIFARTFSQWVAYRIEKLGIKDTFLSPEIDSGKVTEIPVNELKKLDKYFEDLVTIWIMFLQCEITSDYPAKTKNPFLNPNQTGSNAGNGKKAAEKSKKSAKSGQLSLFKRK